MTLRRTTFAAIRLLAIYLAVRSLPGILLAFDEARQSEFQRWIQLAGDAAPLAAAVALWIGASWLAVQCTGGEILTMDELRLLVDHKVGGPEDEPVSEAPERLRPLVLVGVFLLGLFLIVDAIAPMISAFLRFVFSGQVSFVCVFRERNLADPSCPFWNVDSIQALITFGAHVLQVGAGIWLMARPERTLDLVETLRKRWGSSTPVDEANQEPDEEAIRRRWGPVGESEDEGR